MTATNGKTRQGGAHHGMARDIWLAGLGALATAGTEGGRTLKHLAKKGEGVEREQQEAVRRVIGRWTRLRGRIGREAARLIEPIVEGMRATTRQFGVPRRNEVVVLTRRVERLTRELARGRARKPVARRRVPRSAHHGLTPATTS
jgi:poly(hydroxyalkanoate) granule-associated protein